MAGPPPKDEDAPKTASNPPGPTKGQFRKGESGNPKGRPRGRKKVGSASPTSAFDILFEETTVTQSGIAAERPFEEVLQLRAYQDALAGNKLARREVIRMIIAREKALARANTKSRFPSIVQKTEGPDPRNADAALLLLGIAERNSARETIYSERPHLQLQSWAVQMALSRRRGGEALSERERAEITRCSTEPDKLHWPRGGRQ